MSADDADKPNENGAGAGGVGAGGVGAGGAGAGGPGDSGDGSVLGRRRLGAIIGLGSAAYGVALVVPAVAYLGAGGGSQGEARWIRVAQLERLEEGKPERVRILGEARDAFTLTKGQNLGSVWLTRAGETVRALSAECPHLGCAVGLEPDGKNFGCPCHTSRFALDGKSEGGPSPRAMDELAARVVDGWVEVDYRRYRQGIPEQVPVGG